MLLSMYYSEARCLFFSLKYPIVYLSGSDEYRIMCQKVRKILTGPTYKLLATFTVISYGYRSFIPNKATFTKDRLTQWISKLKAPRELLNPLSKTVLGKLMGLLSTVNATVYKTEPIFIGLGHNKLS